MNTVAVGTLGWRTGLGGGVRGWRIGCDGARTVFVGPTLPYVGLAPRPDRGCDVAV